MKWCYKSLTNLGWYKQIDKRFVMSPDQTPAARWDMKLACYSTLLLTVEITIKRKYIM